eukprot:9472014-Pyramimonas_sp.AAC.1
MLELALEFHRRGHADRLGHLLELSLEQHRHAILGGPELRRRGTLAPVGHRRLGRGQWRPHRPIHVLLPQVLVDPLDVVLAADCTITHRAKDLQDVVALALCIASPLPLLLTHLVCAMHLFEHIRELGNGLHVTYFIIIGSRPVIVRVIQLPLLFSRGLEHAIQKGEPPHLVVGVHSHGLRVLVQLRLLQELDAHRLQRNRSETAGTALTRTSHHADLGPLQDQRSPQG